MDAHVSNLHKINDCEPQSTVVILILVHIYGHLFYSALQMKVHSYKGFDLTNKHLAQNVVNHSTFRLQALFNPHISYLYYHTVAFYCHKFSWSVFPRTLFEDAQDQYTSSWNLLFGMLLIYLLEAILQYNQYFYVLEMNIRT